MNVPRVVLAILAGLVAACAQEVIFDAYYGKPLSDKRNDTLLGVVNGTRMCTVPVRACNKKEGRRVDGTCSNPHYPSRGATITPLLRLLPPHFGPGNSLRNSKSGETLPSARHIRTSVLSDAHYITGKLLTNLASYVFANYVLDSVDIRYLLRYGIASDCCINNQIPNFADPTCIPIPVPADDPFLRRTNIRCMNLTRFETFQDHGCISNNLPRARYSRATPLLDLSLIYGNTEARSKAIRSNMNGLLTFMMEGEREVPAGRSPVCLGNRPQLLELACYNFGDDFGGNSNAPIAVISLWFFREHNRLARQLATINPCWNDEQLFKTARKINIAQWQYIFYYELIPEFIGYKNALSSGVIFNSHNHTHGYVNDFDPECEPGVYSEFVLGLRKIHDAIPGFMDIYRNGSYIGSRSAVDDVLRTGILPKNGTEADITFSIIYQPADKYDRVIDSDLSNRALGEFHAASDITAIDIMRARDSGFLSYNHYRQFCGMKFAKTFHDLHDCFDHDTIETLSRLFEDVEDLDLMTGIFLERIIPGTVVGPVLYCIMTHNFKMWRHSDKFFFEHGGFHAALTESQLAEVRHTSMSRIICDNGIDIQKIQPHAFLRLSKKNDFVPCETIPGVDLHAWHDPNCVSHHSHWKK